MPVDLVATGDHAIDRVQQSDRRGLVADGLLAAAEVLLAGVLPPERELIGVTLPPAMEVGDPPLGDPHDEGANRMDDLPAKGRFRERLEHRRDDVLVVPARNLRRDAGLDRGGWRQVTMPAARRPAS